MSSQCQRSFPCFAFVRYLPVSIVLDTGTPSATPYTPVSNLRPPRPTIKDVARAANVSQSTVSYILNDAQASKRISEATKQRVWRAIEKLGYKFNPIGRALQRGYSNQVTLLIVSWNLATSHAATAMAISRAAAKRDLALTVHVA